MWPIVKRLRGSGRLPRAMREAPRLAPDAETPAPTKRYVLLINPFYPKDPRTSFAKHVLTPSMALASIAAATPPDWEVRYWDENLLQGPPPAEPFPQVVGITVHLTFARRAYELAAWYRERGAAVVLGGLHVASCAAEAAPHADALVVGEGVQVWPEVLRDAAAGRLKKRYEGADDHPYAAAPWPRRDVLDRRDFLTTQGLIATRGCQNRCGFCYLSTRGLRMPYRVRDVADVAAEFAAGGEPYAVFTDNNLCCDPDYLRALCRALRPLERIWSAAVTVNIADDPGLVREMAQAGCTGVFLGLETLTSSNLAAANKRSPHPDDYARRVEVFHREGIQVTGSFVLGFDGDGPDVFERTVDWIEAARLECATFHILTPYPGTPLFRQLDEEGRILHRNWDLYDTGHAVFRPRQMSPDDLEAGYAWSYRRLFSLASIWRRRPERTRDIPPFLAMTLLYKKANWLWPFLIRHRLTHAVWQPLVEAARRRHVRHRAAAPSAVPAAWLPFPAGV